VLSEFALELDMGLVPLNPHESQGHDAKFRVT